MKEKAEKAVAEYLSAQRERSKALVSLVSRRFPAPHSRHLIAAHLASILVLRSALNLEDVAVQVDLIQQGARKFHQRLVRHHLLPLFQ